MKLTCMPYEMVDFAKEDAVQDWLSFASDMMDGVDVLTVDAESPWSLIAFYKRMVRETGLPISMLYPMRPLIEDGRRPSQEAVDRTAAGMRRDMDLAEELGVSRLRYCVNPGYPYFAGVDFDINYGRLVENVVALMRGVLPEAERRGIAIMIENHPGEIGARKAFFDTLFSEISSPALGINLDLVNTLFYRDQRPEDFLDDPKIFARAQGFHICNLGDPDGTPGKLAADDGRLDTRRMLKDIQAKGYDGWLTFEYSGQSREHISHSMQFIREVWAE